MNSEISIARRRSEKLDFFELMVNGRRFGFTEEEQKAFEDFLSAAPGDEVELTFLHSLEIKLDRPNGRSPQAPSSPGLEENKKDSTAYNCTVRVPKETARRVYLDKQERCKHVVELLAEGALRFLEKRMYRETGRRLEPGKGSLRED